MYTYIFRGFSLLSILLNTHTFVPVAFKKSDNFAGLIELLLFYCMRKQFLLFGRFFHKIVYFGLLVVLYFISFIVNKIFFYIYSMYIYKNILVGINNKQISLFLAIN